MTTEYEGATPLQPYEACAPWSEESAQHLATQGGLGTLSESHWQLIYTLRNHYVQYGALPPKRLACGLNHLAPNCVDQLFRDPREAWRIAGLPEPGTEQGDYSQ